METRTGYLQGMHPPRLFRAALLMQCHARGGSRHVAGWLLLSDANDANGCQWAVLSSLP